MTRSSPAYRGRFAPSPTGPLHAGSLFAAVASYLDARSAGGQWLVRIEDLDPPREQPGADLLILQSMAAHGLSHDDGVLYQSSRLDVYEQALQALLDKGVAYYCTCSRRRFNENNGRHAAGCPQSHTAPDTSDAAIRACFHSNTSWQFADRIQGSCSFRFDTPVDDFVLRRRDGLIAYQLAVVVDDHFQQITDVVRGIDLLDSTPRQMWLQQQLGLPPVRYAHLPVLVDEDGNKLSKQQQAPAIDDLNAEHNLRDCLQLLGFRDLPADAGIAELLEWATSGWPAACESLAKAKPERYHFG